MTTFNEGSQKMSRKIVLAGGSAYLGRALARHFLDRGDRVISMCRKPLTPWPGEQVELWDGETLGPWARCLEGADAVINLAGRTVNCRYTRKNRQEMWTSRVLSTRALRQAISAAVHPPRVWLNSSTATIYRNALDRNQDEATGEIGKGFSVEIAKAWESELFAGALPRTRRVAMRTAMVFGPGPGGVWEAFQAIVRQGLGGRNGSGRQFVSWIHIDDFIAAVDFLIEHADLSGAINVAAPDPRPNREFMKSVRHALGVPIGLPAPEWLLEIGAFFKRTETELLLKSRRVVPGRLLQSGFQFKYPNLETALGHLTSPS